MNVNCRLRKSNENWKSKAIDRSSENCELRKKIKRLEEQSALEKLNHDVAIELLKEEIKKSLILATSDSNADSVTYQKLRVLFIQTLIVGVVSFRAVPRIFKIISNSIKVTPHIIPHFTSLINWALRAGIGVFEKVSPIQEPWIAIIDMSNTIGTRKVFVVMRVLASRLGENGKAICLEDSECIGIESNGVWTGETVCEALDKVFLKVGMPVAILKDGGGDLKKGVRLLLEKYESKNIIIIDDIGHVVANILKAEYQKKPEFIKFLKLITKGSAKIRQTIAAWALAPKLRTKGRFLGVTKLAGWAKDMLAILDGNDSEISQEELMILKKTFSGLTELRPFIEKFIRDCEAIEQLLAVMKNKGLNKKTAKEVKSILSKLPIKSQVNQRLSAWLIKHQAFQMQMPGWHTLLVSSDIIESLFGKFKSIIQRSPRAELNKLIYIIPLLCGKRTDLEISNALLQCPHLKMQEYISTNVPTTIKQQRYKLPTKTKNEVPNLRNFTSGKAA